MKSRRSKEKNKTKKTNQLKKQSKQNRQVKIRRRRTKILLKLSQTSPRKLIKLRKDKQQRYQTSKIALAKLIPQRILNLKNHQKQPKLLRKFSLIQIRIIVTPIKLISLKLFLWMNLKEMIPRFKKQVKQMIITTMKMARLKT